MSGLRNLMGSYLNSQQESILDLCNQTDIINNIHDVLVSARNKGNNVFLMGNGGSASTASHFTSDLLKTSLLKNIPKFKAFSLSDNIPVLLAWANDSSYEEVFVGQLENLLNKDDVVIGISGSGNSPNVLKAVKFANENGGVTISLTGKGGGKLAKLAKLNLVVKSQDMLTIETMHLLICHLITTMIRSGGEPSFTY